MPKVTLTVACPEADRGDATDLAVALGWAEGWTPEEWEGAFTKQFRDAQGNLYRVMSLPVSEGFVLRAAPNEPIERPEQDVDPGPEAGYVVNLASARRAQGKLEIWMPTDPRQPVPTADPSQIVAVVGLPGVEALSAMGLGPVTGDLAGA